MKKIIPILFSLSLLGNLVADPLDLILPEDAPGTRGAVFRFLRNPQDLEVTLGYSRMSYFSYLANFYDTSESDQVNQEVNQIGHRTDGLNAMRLGLQFGRSYLDLRLSPWWGDTRSLILTDDFYDPPTNTVLDTYKPNEAFLLDARTGLYYEPFQEDSIEFRLAMEFYGTYLTFKDPISLGIKNNSQVLSLGGGYGIVMVGVGIPFTMGFTIPLNEVQGKEHSRLVIRAGVLTRIGVLLPWELAGELQVLGPDVDYWIVEDLAVYFSTQPFKLRVGMFAHGFNHWELGVKYRL